MSARKPTPDHIETALLIQSGRRCCLCFGLHKDFGLKRGQIAHLDDDPGNAMIDNLAWLCLEHHAEYDSRARQSKGITRSELKRYRQQLYDAVAQRVVAEHPTPPVFDTEFILTQVEDALQIIDARLATIISQTRHISTGEGRRLTEHEIDTLSSIAAPLCRIVREWRKSK